MLFQSLDKLKRQSILAAILMMALGVIMLICPESYVNTLVVTVGYGMIIFAIVEMLEFIVSKKSLDSLHHFYRRIIYRYSRRLHTNL